MAVQINGLDSLMRKLSSMGGSCMDALQVAVRRTTAAAQTSAKKWTVEDTGNLRLHNFVRWDAQGEKFSGMVYNNTDYAMYVEMGTSKMDAQPYMLPALKENTDVFQKEAENALKNAIRKAAK